MKQVISVTNSVFIIILLAAVILYSIKFCYWFIGLRKQKPFKKAKTKHKFAIVIPARFESKVIRGVLDSIKNQDYDKNLIDTFIIVPDETDETIEIAKEYENTFIHILDHKVNCKGATMDSLFKQILKENPDKYEGYFIVDADNVLENNFVDLMNDAYDTGKYEIVLGGRSNKNWEDGWVSNCSALTFSLVNGLNNKARTRLGGNVTISGSGLLIDNKVIQENGGWPWQSLTEDYEISKVSFIKDYRSCYYEHARTYDEQPRTLEQSSKQIIRWLKGHSDVDNMYRKDIMKKCFARDTKHKLVIFDFCFGLIPILMVLFSFACFAILNFGYTIVALCLGDPTYLDAILNTVYTIVGFWGLFVLYSSLGLIADRVNIKMNIRSRFATVFMSPIFFVRYVPMFLKSICVKELTWERIDHSKDMSGSKKKAKATK